MQELLDKLIAKLNTDEFCAVSVFDLETSQFIYRNKTHAQIQQEFESAENFFEEIFNTGKTKFSIQERRKNGSVFKAFGEPILTNNVVKESEPMQNFEAPVQQPVSNPNFSQVGGFGLGLGTLDVMNLMVDSHEAKRLKNENETLKLENKRLEKENYEYKDEKLSSKYNQENKSMITGLIGEVMKNAPVLINMVKGGAPTGLNAPAPVEPITQFDPTTKQILIQIGNTLATNEAFGNDLFELLKNYQLWE